jgi:hypothetical protein
MTAHTGPSSDFDDEDYFKEMSLENDPVFRLSQTMLEETSEALPRIKGHELLIEGIVIRLNFTVTPGDNLSNSEADSLTDDESDGRCFVRLEGKPKPQRMKLYGHDAIQLANQRSSDQQEFLLVSRERYSLAPRKMHNALLLIDRDGNVANRVGVASLRLDNVELLDNFQPERRLFKLS